MVQHTAEIVLVEVSPPAEDVWRERIQARAAAEAETAARHKPDWAELQALISGCGFLAWLPVGLPVRTCAAADF